MRMMSGECKKLQEMNKAADDEMRAFEMKYQDMQQELMNTQDKSRQSLQELSAREEEIVVLKIELSNLQEKFKAKLDAFDKLKNDHDFIQYNYHCSGEEIQSLRNALEESRSNGDRLHKESELVVQNVNTWVQEQKEQSKAIMTLTSEKEQLLDQVAQLQKQSNKMKIELEERRDESDRFKALQNHSSHQQVILNQLRSRLEDHEHDQDQEVQSKIATIEDLHSRLKLNIDNIQQLNQQLSTLQKENHRLRNDLDREISSRQTLELQVESKDQTISSLKSQLDAKRHLLIENSSPLKDFDKPDDKKDKILRGGVIDKQRAYGKGLEDAGISDPHALDKNYWIQRVGELSIQLQQSSEYWADKVRELSGQLGKARSTISQSPKPR
ncbi:golgin subfamily A member 5-like isoform X2 [Saccostrea cucullata]|uniref:golgin subfamily A member 5-like isoform X2 n=1 Tax=Saccostrea cuccullata TaxID=36930 RepID=UPI002ED0992C